MGSPEMPNPLGEVTESEIDNFVEGALDENKEEEEDQKQREDSKREYNEAA